MARRGRPLIVGSGIAGLYVALRAQELGLRPTLVTKATLEESNTRYAQGGIAAAIGPGDSPALHLRDTVRAGAGLVDLRAARVLVEEGPRRIADLVRRGVPFDTVEGHISLGREAAHGRARILHAGGDATGLQVEETLKRRVIEAGIETRERTQLRGLRVVRPGAVAAALQSGSSAGTEPFEAGPIVLATGGAGSLYRESSNPAVATGEGVAVAARAGAVVSDLEFMQFHPTVFSRAGAPRFLLTEALRGEGAVVRNAAGDRFLPRYTRAAELAPRDVVTRAIRAELARTHTRYAFLDARGIGAERLYTRFPTVCRFLRSHGLDPARDPIPITPAAHFMIGGVTTDLHGRTSLAGLFACGEVASTGVHGANRLASNSLLEGLVFGERVARALARPRAGIPSAGTVPIALAPDRRAARAPARGLLGELRRTLWQDVGIVRDRPGLDRAVRRLTAEIGRYLPEEGAEPVPPLALSTLTALLIAVAARAREESRGAHYRADFPRPRARWRRHLRFRLLAPGAAGGKGA